VKPDDAARLAAELLEHRERELVRQRGTGPWPRMVPIASDLSGCARELALSLLYWESRPPLLDPPVLARLDRGSAIETLVVRELLALGWTVRAERATAELRDRDGRVLIRGRIDGFVSAPGSRDDVPLEIKSVMPAVWSQLTSVEALDRIPWTRRYVYQLQVYLAAYRAEAGWLLLDDCLGHWRIIVVPANESQQRWLIEQARLALRARDLWQAGAMDGSVLPPYTDDLELCRRCWAYGRYCFPPRLEQTGAVVVLDDPELPLQLARREALAAAAAEYRALDEAVKERCRGITRALAGDWLIEGREITAQYPAQPARVVKSWRTKITRLTPSDSGESV